MTKQTQGRRLIDMLKLRPMTSMELQMTGVSVCWWKRVAESLRDDETLIAVEVNGRKQYRVWRSNAEFTGGRRPSGATPG
jgi:hypothetical protein